MDRPWLLGRRKSPARLWADGRFSGRAILDEAQLCCSSAVDHSSFPAYLRDPTGVQMYWAITATWPLRSIHPFPATSFKKGSCG